MVHATVGALFDDDLEGGCLGLKISLDRCCVARVALRDQKEGRRDENGNMKFDGKIIRKKGDTYKVDVCVTGANVGSSTNPKFALLHLWKNKLFPMIHKLTEDVDTNTSPCRGARVIYQEDHAGPHDEAEFTAFMDAEVAKHDAWLRADQAAQGPYLNVLDLAIFPSMSKQHSKILQQNSNVPVSKEIIMETARDVWKDMPSWKIAMAFVQFYRICKLIIAHNGNNKWLAKGAPHLGIRDYFKRTDRGCERKNLNRPWHVEDYM